MKFSTTFATLFIAACVISTGAAAQKVYKCGANYSQTPCPDAVTVDADDTRSRDQKAATDKAIARDVASADAIEKARLQEEKLADKQRQSAASGDKTSKAKSKTKSESKEKKKASKKKGPEFFTATTPTGK